jgi:hypothetical protein
MRRASSDEVEAVARELERDRAPHPPSGSDDDGTRHRASVRMRRAQPTA